MLLLLYFFVLFFIFVIIIFIDTHDIISHNDSPLNSEAEVDHDDIEVEMDDDGTENYENNSGDENNNEGEEEEESASLPRRFLRSLLGNRKGHKSSEKDRSKLQISFDKSLPAAHSVSIFIFKSLLFVC